MSTIGTHSADAVSGAPLDISKLATPEVRPSELKYEADLAVAQRFSRDLGLARQSGVLSCFLRRFLDTIEGPHATEVRDLPDRKVRPKAVPYRSSPKDTDDLLRRRAIVKSIENSRVSHKISDWTELHEFRVPVRSEHAGLHGLTMLHLSDIHFRSGDSRAADDLLATAKFFTDMNRSVDLIVFTGDLITRSPKDLNQENMTALKVISQLAQHSFSIRGNHDHHGHQPLRISRLIKKCGFIDITDGVAELRRGSDKINIFGVDDHWYGRRNVFQIPEEHRSSFNVVAVHNPDSLTSDFPDNISLVVSGHTHGFEANLLNSKYLLSLAVRCMRIFAPSTNINGIVRGFDFLRGECLMHISPGLGRSLVTRPFFRYPPAVTLLQFVGLDDC